MEMFQCKGPCGKDKPRTSFYNKKQRRNNQLVVTIIRDPVCKDCRFDERQDPERKLNSKIRSAISNEAKKLGVDSERLFEWGVTFEWVKYMLLRELNAVKSGFHWCANCQGNPDPTKICYKDENIDLDNFTFDVTDPERMYRTRKLTRSNCRWICDSANNSKGSRDPTEYDIDVMQTYIEQRAIKDGYQPEITPILQPALFQ